MKTERRHSVRVHQRKIDAPCPTDTAATEKEEGKLYAESEGEKMAVREKKGLVGGWLFIVIPPQRVESTWGPESSGFFW